MKIWRSGEKSYHIHRLLPETRVGQARSMEAETAFGAVAAGRLRREVREAMEAASANDGFHFRAIVAGRPRQEAWEAMAALTTAAHSSVTVQMEAGDESMPLPSAPGFEDSPGGSEADCEAAPTIARSVMGAARPGDGDRRAPDGRARRPDAPGSQAGAGGGGGDAGSGDPRDSGTWSEWHRLEREQVARFEDLQHSAFLVMCGLIMTASVILACGWWGTTTITAGIAAAATPGNATQGDLPACPMAYCKRILLALDEAATGEGLNADLIPADAIEIEDGLACVCGPARFATYGAPKPLILSSWGSTGTRSRSAWTRSTPSASVESCWATPRRRDVAPVKQSRATDGQRRPDRHRRQAELFDGGDDRPTWHTHHPGRAPVVWYDDAVVGREAAATRTSGQEDVPRLCAAGWPTAAPRTSWITCNRVYEPHSNPNVCVFFLNDDTRLCSNLVWKQGPLEAGGGCTLKTETAMSGKDIERAMDAWARTTGQWNGTVTSDCCEQDAPGIDCFWVSAQGGRWDWRLHPTTGMTTRDGAGP